MQYTNRVNLLTELPKEQQQEGLNLNRCVVKVLNLLGRPL